MASSVIHRKLKIGGMTCVNCQNRIEQKLRGTAGVVEASASYNAGTVDVTYDTDILSLQDIIGAIEALDYEVLPEQEARGGDVGRVACMLVIIVCLYILLQQSGVLNLLVPSQLADTGMGYGMLFLTGLATSVHCIAMCGGINLSQCVPRRREDGGGRAAALLPAALYNLGRVISYTVIGFLLGFAGRLLGGGAEAGLSTFLQGVLKLAAGTFMVVMGVNMLNLFPWLRPLTLRPPKFLVRAVGARRANGSGPLAVGLLNGLMPCGPLQSMQIVALASADPFAGALSMLLFSLGTVPLMLGLGSIVSALGRRFTQAVMTAGAVLVVVLGLAMLSQGGSLSGLLGREALFLLIVLLCALGVVASLPFSKSGHRSMALAAAVCVAVLVFAFRGTRSAAGEPSETGAASMAEVVDGVQVVTSTLSPGQYPDITVQAGTPVRWIINAPEGSINGCNYKMILREYGLEVAFQEGENVVEFTPTEAGVFQYSCWMGMIYGTITVTGADGTVPDTAAPDASDGPVPAGYQIPTEELAVAELVTDESGEVRQQVTIQLTEDGFQPAVLVVQEGVPALWTIQNSLDTDGGAVLLAPAYATSLPLIQGENPITLYADESFAVSTSDNAFFAYVKMVDDIGKIDEDAVRQEDGQFETLIYPEAAFSAATASCCQ